MRAEVAKTFVEISVFFLKKCVTDILFYFIQVWYLADPSDGPSGLQCSPINLYTVPV
jgi:hypothetical protein